MPFEGQFHAWLIFERLFVTSDVLVNEFILGNIAWVERTANYNFALHCSTEYRFNNIDEILFRLETPNKLCMVWGSGTDEKDTSLYIKTSLTDHLPRATTPLYRSLYLGPK